MSYLRRNLLARLVTYFFVLSIVPLIIVMVMAIVRGRSALQVAVENQLDAVVSSKAEEIIRWVQDREDDVFVLSRSPEIADNALLILQGTDEEKATAKRTLNSYLVSNFLRRLDYTAVFLVTPETGEVVFSTNQVQAGENIATSTYYREGRIRSFIDIYISPTTNEPLMTIAAPVFDERSRRIGVLGVHLSLARMDRIILERSGLGNEGETYLVSSASRLLVGGVGESVTEEVTSGGIVEALDGNNGQGQYLSHKGVPVIGVYRWIRGLDIAILAELPETEAFEASRQLSLTLLLFSVVVALLVAIVARTIAVQIADPILRVTETAVKVSGGDLTSTAVVSSQDEIGILARTFNQMTERLRRLYISLEAQVTARTAELANRVEQLDLINKLGRDTASILQLEMLLSRAVKQIRQTFDFYFVGLFILDESGKYVTLAANETNEEKYVSPDVVALPVEILGIIREAIIRQQPVAVNDVSKDARYETFELLPKTQAELCLPLMVGDKILGILDLQSTQVNAFSEDDIPVLQTLADQMAIAIQNASLYTDAQEAKAEAEEANRLKTQFLTNMSHELRTPLNAVINFAYLLSMGVQGPLTDGQKDMLDRIGGAGNHLLHLINDILDLAKIESGRTTLYKEEVELAEIVSAVMSTAIGLVKDKDVELKQDIPEDLPIISADRGRIRQVLLNLVSNAAKFTVEGSVTVKAVADDTYLTVSVADTGIGIAEEDIPKAFAEFSQVDGEMTRKTGGTGLGLPISRKFVEMHGGQMWVESEVGKGSTFLFTLPHLSKKPVYEIEGEVLDE